MPHILLTTPQISPEQRERLAHEITDMIVQIMGTSHAGGLTPEELREQTLLRFMPYEPTMMAVGGKLMRDRAEQDVIMELCDWGLHPRLQRRLANELTSVLAKNLNLLGHLDRVHIRFHSDAVTDIALGGKLLSDLVPWLGQVMMRLQMLQPAPPASPLLRRPKAPTSVA